MFIGSWVWSRCLLWPHYVSSWRRHSSPAPDKRMINAVTWLMTPWHEVCELTVLSLVNCGHFLTFDWSTKGPRDTRANRGSQLWSLMRTDICNHSKYFPILNVWTLSEFKLTAAPSSRFVLVPDNLRIICMRCYFGQLSCMATSGNLTSSSRNIAFTSFIT